MVGVVGSVAAAVLAVAVLRPTADAGAPAEASPSSSRRRERAPEPLARP
jgi:hypothetical protein